VTEQVQVEATGETVGEAKWNALHELERLHPQLDKESVQYQVVSEGQRGILGVGFQPARVVAAGTALASAPPPLDETDTAGLARAVVERSAKALGVSCRVDVHENDGTLELVCSGGDLGVLIGKHGQTIDSIQYLANAIVHRSLGDEAPSVVIDAAGYRARRAVVLHGIAERAVQQAHATGQPVELEPMTAVERKVVHERLKELGAGSASEGAEPNRFVVVHADPAASGSAQ
jgi:spoIIIJ-associated protein